MRTVRFIPRHPALLALIGSVVLAAIVVGWIAVQNARYDARKEAAFKPVMEAFQRTPTGLDEKNAIVAKHYPGVVDAVQIQGVIYEVVFLPDFRRSYEAMRTMEAPPLWRGYHDALVEVHRTGVNAFEAQYAQVRYATKFLGNGGSIERIAALETDPEYVSLGHAAHEAVEDADRASAALSAAVPRIASWLPGSPDRTGNGKMKVGTMATNAISKSSDCAQAELDDKPAPVKDCARLLRYGPEQPACMVSVGSMVGPCPERAVACPPSTDPNAPTTGPDGLPMPPSYRAASAPASLCG